MSATLQRDQVYQLAGTDATAALAKARGITDPWFRAQALAAVARHTTVDPGKIAAEAARAAAACPDAYQQVAVRAWEIAALGGRGLSRDASRSLSAALALAGGVEPVSSRAEALILLMHAAFTISTAAAGKAGEKLAATCPADRHWRCKRALRDAALLMDGGLSPRPFF